ncbi:hypothetical protein EG327_010008 [Venturia inaequalis]|uniref:3-methylitaconate isomerase n=1 Tax=Venturia inaequalis TaxID=5025 RepID=A0A8H3UKD9_VENIN|nr:hypothetical protein EG327_010008 [Venturia inaequalis]
MKAFTSRPALLRSWKYACAQRGFANSHSKHVPRARMTREETDSEISRFTATLDNSLDLFLEEHSSLSLLTHHVKELRRAADRLESAIAMREERTSTAFRQKSIPAGYYRGGTSRAVILQKSNLSDDEEERHDAFRQIIGSNDPHGRQLNGMGAGVSSLSKICLVEPAPPEAEAEADILYTFVGMGIEGDEVDLNGNCGNMAAAIGPYVFNEHALAYGKGKCNGKRMLNGLTCDGFGTRPIGITYNILNTNTNVMIRSSFYTMGTEAYVDDSTSIDGVTGYGTGVTLDFLSPGGSKTGKLLPTGKAVDIINDINVSCVDAANPCVFVKASDLGIEPTILPTQFLARPIDLQKLEDIRSQAAVLMGLCKVGDTPPRVIPKIGIVSPPVEQQVLSKETNAADTLDLVVRFISDGQPHRAIPLTAALCTAAAAKVPGSVVQQCVRETPVNADVITIGHPSGRIQVNATMDDHGYVECCTVVRTARRIMSGHVYYTPKLTPKRTPEDST